MDEKLAIRIMSVLSVAFGVVVSLLASNDSPALIPVAAVGGAVLVLLWILVGLNHLRPVRRAAKSSKGLR